MFYQLRLAARRNKVAFAAVVAAGVILIVATALTARFAMRAREERDDAIAARETQRIESLVASRINEFLLDPSLAGGDLPAREVLARAAVRIERELAQEPQVRGALNHALGMAYLRLSVYPKASDHLSRAVVIYRGLGFREHELASLRELAWSLACHGEFDRSESIIAEALKRLPGDPEQSREERICLLSSLAQVLAEKLDLPAALDVRRQVLEGERQRDIYGALFGADDARTQSVTKLLAALPEG